MFFFNKREEEFTPGDSLFQSDEKFNGLYPVAIKSVAQKHWTPVNVARRAAEFLAATPGEKILDVGSGAGKFCLTAAHFYPLNEFYGIEQRDYLVDLCEELKNKLAINNAFFLRGNITTSDTASYQHFYFYNSFYENIKGTQKIDELVTYSEALYDHYNRFFYKLLNGKPAGTRLATYHSFGSEIPPGYEIVNSAFGEYLKLYIKV